MKFSTETSNLILRPFEMKDASDYYDMVQDPLICKYTEGAYVDNLSETEYCFKTIYTKGDFKNDFYIAIEEKWNHKLVGAIIAVRTIEQNYDTSYFISKEFRGKGYMKEALKAFLETIPHFVQKGTLQFTIRPRNIASLAVINSIDGICEAYMDGFRKFYYHINT